MAKNLLALALELEPELEARRGLAAPGAVGVVEQLFGPVDLTRKPGIIEMSHRDTEPTVIIWYLCPETGVWTRHPRLQEWYHVWAEGTKTQLKVKAAAKKFAARRKKND